MSGDDWGHLIYLGLLGAGVAGWFFTSGRTSANKLLQQIALWALIFIGVIAAYGMWDDIRSTVTPRQSVVTQTGAITLPRTPDGHYYARARVNDAEIRFVVDTGASGVVLRKADAQAAGIDLARLAFVSEAMTANGPVRIALTRVDPFGLPGAETRGFTVSVNEGEMRESLLGMSYLQRFSSITLAGDEMVLQP